MPGPDGTLTGVGRPQISEGTVQQAANGVKSSVNDLLVYYKAVLDAWRLETGSGISQDQNLPPLKSVKELLTPHIPLDPDADGQWYSAGWATSGPDDCSEKNDYVSLAKQSAAAYDDMWARWPDLDVPTYVFHFGTDEKGHIETLQWEHDPDVPGGETFVKKSNETLDHRVPTELSGTVKR